MTILVPLVTQCRLREEPLFTATSTIGHMRQHDCMYTIDTIPVNTARVGKRSK